MRIALIGMAGSGKSYWSMKLEKLGFIRFCCDDIIAQKLSAEINPSGLPTKTVAEWMGFPDQSGYSYRESRYLQCEKEAMEEILTYLSTRSLTTNKDIVVDTTGSIIYLPDKLLRRLQELTTVVLLSTPAEVMGKLLQDYITRPHPMVWSNNFQKSPGETRRQALERCYPQLFKSRQMLYQKYAHISLDYYELRAKGFDADHFLAQIQGLSRGNLAR